MAVPLALIVSSLRLVVHRTKLYSSALVSAPFNDTEEIKQGRILIIVGTEAKFPESKTSDKTITKSK